MGTIPEVRYPLDPVVLRPAAPEPLHRQLYEQLRALILDGTIPAGARLPSIRDAAAHLGVSRNTVIAALDQLAAEGLTETRRGAGTNVARSVVPGPRRSATRDGPAAGLSARGTLMADQASFGTTAGRTLLHPGLPDLPGFPFKTWSRLLTRHARYGGDDLFGYHHVLGHPRLRAAIARFLTAMRRVECTPAQIVVTTGGQAALDVLARTLLDPGDIVWMEEPGYLGARGAFRAAGARLHPLAVGRDGWTIDPGAPAPALVYLTPSCQLPLGLTMPLHQRQTLLEIARERGAWIVEDDFDGEYTFRGQPLPALQGLAGDAPVIYVGTFAKILFPAMRIGFVVVPEAIAQRLKPVLSVTGQFAPLLLQATLADFIEEGYFFRHLNRMRRLYGQRRAAFVARFEADLSDRLELYPGWTGLQLAASFRHPVDDTQVHARCRDRGLNPAPLSLYYVGDRPVPGLLMGYAALSMSDMHRSLGALGQVVAECRAG